ncbi:oxidoreductase [Xylariomycetidae sp. FL2044]|nr:oxidoreductase [Xylariomycetidae sp. FL2044]
MRHIQTLLIAELTAIAAASAAGGSSPFPRAIAPRTSTTPTAGLPHLSWTVLPTNSTFQFRGLAPVSDKIAWVSGTNSSVLLTQDGGQTWSAVGPALDPEDDADAPLEFRDVEAWSAREAVVLSIGAGSASRLYRTRDGGASWDLSFANAEVDAFYDCVAFDDSGRGIAMSDPVDGRFRLLESVDRGRTWDVVDPKGMPPAAEGEFGFAASGTCVTTAAGRWYVATGGVNPGRVLSSADGYVWDVVNSSIAGGAAGGVFSVQFRDARHGIAVGGDYEAPTGAVDNAAWSDDGGLTWTPATSFPGGYRSGSSWIPGLRGVAIAVGPTGSDITVDGGRTWHGFYNGSFDSVECVGGHVCWASGEAGRVARLTWS